MALGKWRTVTDKALAGIVLPRDNDDWIAKASCAIPLVMPKSNNHPLGVPVAQVYFNQKRASHVLPCVWHSYLNIR